MPPRMRARAVREYILDVRFQDLSDLSGLFCPARDLTFLIWVSARHVTCRYWKFLWRFCLIPIGKSLVSALHLTYTNIHIPPWPLIYTSSGTGIRSLSASMANQHSEPPTYFGHPQSVRLSKEEKTVNTITFSDNNSLLAVATGGGLGSSYGCLTIWEVSEQRPRLKQAQSLIFNSPVRAASWCGGTAISVGLADGQVWGVNVQACIVLLRPRPC